MQQTIHGDCTELTAFVCEHLFVCLHNPFSWEFVCCIHHPHRKHEQDQLFLGPLLYIFFWGCATSIPFLCSSFLADRIKYSETPKYSEQYFCDQTGENPMLSTVELSYVFGDSYSKKSSDANSSCELSVSIISIMFSFSGGLVDFSYSVTHCLRNF